MPPGSSEEETGIKERESFGAAPNSLVLRMQKESRDESPVLRCPRCGADDF